MTRFQPPNVAGAPLVPLDQATAILWSALLRGAMVGELRSEEAHDAWLAAHPDQVQEHGAERAWKKAQGRAEMLLVGWQEQRRSHGRRLI